MADSSHVTMEMYVPNDYVFLDAHPSYAIVVHKTASPGMPFAEDTGRYFQSGSEGRHVSSHYIVGLNGHIVQCVREKDGAGANAALPVEAGRNPLFQAAINWNLKTISIEHVDIDPNNGSPLTPAQKAASFALILDVANRKGIAPDHIVEHKDLQPVSKPQCAGNYPIEELRTYIRNNKMGPKLNRNGEVIDIQAVSQFLPNKTEYACGFFAASCIAHAGEPGKGPAGTASEIDAWAIAQYEREYGSSGANMVGGVSIDDMHRLLVAALPHSGVSHYYDLDITPNTSQASDLAHIRGALQSGYPVVATVTEASVHDLQLAGNNPYYWGASGSHVFLITGVDKDGNLLVHDPANIVGSLTGANTPRPQPRTYDHTTLDCTWASAIRCSWLAPFPNGWDPIKSAPLNQVGNVVSKPEVPVSGPVHNYKDPFIIDLWTRGIQPTPVRDTPIFNAWKERLYSGHTIGTVRSAQSDIIDENGDVCEYQSFDGGICIRRKKDGNIRWL